YILIFFIITTSLFATDQIGVVTGTDGDSFRKGSQKDKYTKLMVSESVFQGDTIKTSNGTVKIVFDDDSSLYISKNSLFKLDEFLVDNGKNKRVSNLSLLSGKIKMIISQKFGTNKFEIKTPHVTIGVRGTTFVLSHSEEEGTEINLIEGELYFKSNLGRFADLTLTQNQYIIYKDGETPTIRNMDLAKLTQVLQDFETPKDFEITRESEKFKDLSEGSILSKADSYIELMKKMLDSSFEALKNARKEKSLMKLNCINDNVMTIKGYLKRSEDDRMNIEDLLSREQLNSARDTLSKIYEAYSAAKQADIALQSCSGNVMTYDGKKDVVVEIEETYIGDPYLDKELDPTSKTIKTESLFSERDVEVIPISASPYF
ncbi:FecR domain-containing protein, partial [bacterium]|nr:FecR domain-containing protein [bacterium]